MHKNIHITGASCAGVTTLGTALAEALGSAHVDCDDHYWLRTDPPFTEKSLPADRVTSIVAALGANGWVLSGSLIGWGDRLIENVDLIVFLSTPTPLRMQRLVERERQRFGNRIEPGGDMFGIHSNFAAWAREYENPEFQGRNRARHEKWLDQQTAQVLRMNGAQPVGALIKDIIAAL